MRTKSGLLAALAITLTLAAPAAAQTQLGVLAGLSFSTVKTNPCLCDVLTNELGDGPNWAEMVRKGGLVAGLTVERPLSERVHLRVNALYSVVHFSLNAEYSDFMSAKSSGPVPAGGPYIPTYVIDQELAMRRFEVDTLASIPIGRQGRASILAGLFTSFGMGQAERQTTYYDDGYVDEWVPGSDEQIEFSAFDMGIGLGAEFAPLRRVNVGVMLKLGLWNILPDSGFDAVKTSRFQVYTRIPLGKTR
jgi:hypothetical protein